MTPTVAPSTPTYYPSLSPNTNFYISTIAGTGATSYSGDGGDATSAALNNPFGVAVDSSGNVYIGDCGNHRIRMLSISTGIISTIAGTGTSSYSGDGGAATSATLKSPQGVAVDSSGKLSEYYSAFTHLIHSFRQRVQR